MPNLRCLDLVPGKFSEVDPGISNLHRDFIAANFPKLRRVSLANFTFHSGLDLSSLDALVKVELQNCLIQGSGLLLPPRLKSVLFSPLSDPAIMALENWFEKYPNSVLDVVEIFRARLARQRLRALCATLCKRVSRLKFVNVAAYDSNQHDIPSNAANHDASTSIIDIDVSNLYSLTLMSVDSSTHFRLRRPTRYLQVLKVPLRCIDEEFADAWPTDSRLVHWDLSGDSIILPFVRLILEKCPNLQLLNVEEDMSTFRNFLAKDDRLLCNLKTLKMHVSNSRSDDFTILNQCSRLVSLHLYSTRMEYLDWLHMPHVVDLYLETPSPIDVSLTGRLFPALKRAYLHCSSSSEIQISELPTLVRLEIYGAKASKISGVPNLVSLTVSASTHSGFLDVPTLGAFCSYIPDAKWIFHSNFSKLRVIEIQQLSGLDSSIESLLRPLSQSCDPRGLDTFMIHYFNYNDLDSATARRRALAVFFGHDGDTAQISKSFPRLSVSISCEPPLQEDVIERF
jgi:hypothetical protein